ncbi:MULTISPECIES: DEAD/DEAH box helicase [unclassified Arcicella]|uniref:DEAD/DEAH box helicase n=1 Tax=unclassified Arcicella TaxID=2644986 RepID=UPI00285E7B0C|nr:MULTISPECIES: DEAD/DEAH box helicase [unclassified Arcicella]MDR6561596.1 ATP-dependent RNA helicase RhlE [Arcicella sp. BE51]MDR6812376.1 ATP-dependent RNA helicase RhlE [Arcicella sp. BE140]MDR6823852.1 ATP-dependent RNA helicase RhlE [Arcicella sp. BE139]
MTFEELNLNKQLLNALEDLGFTSPTAIQEKVFSVVMSGKDVCGIAQTGTGKTYAYLLPCLRQLKFSKEKAPQLVIIVPTRELVVQIVEEAQKLLTYMSFKVLGVYGGVNTKLQVAELLEGADILVATPGRLVDLISVGAFSGKSVKKLVIDEFDEMLNLGFRAQLKIVFGKLPQRRQNLLFSATLNEEVEQLIEDYFNSPVRVEATPVGTPLENISQSYYEVPNFYSKVNFLNLLLAKDETMTKVLVFVSTKHLADVLFEEVSPVYGEAVGVIHSNKAQKHRFDSVDKFQSGECRILIATDIIARGLDVAEVTHVINFDLPETPQNYIHRIGRTGRKERKGIAISFVVEKEKEYLSEIENLMNYLIPQQELPEELILSTKILPAETERVTMKTIQVKAPKKEESGAAFHEKSEKNSKVNVRRNHAAEMKKKYGRAYKKRE